MLRKILKNDEIKQNITFHSIVWANLSLIDCINSKQKNSLEFIFFRIDCIRTKFRIQSYINFDSWELKTKKNMFKLLFVSIFVTSSLAASLKMESFSFESEDNADNSTSLTIDDFSNLCKLFKTTDNKAHLQEQLNSLAQTYFADDPEQKADIDDFIRQLFAHPTRLRFTHKKPLPSEFLTQLRLLFKHA